MSSEDDILKFVIDQFCWAIVIRFYLVTDYFHLFVNLLLWVGAMENNIRQKVYRTWEMVLQDD